VWLSPHGQCLDKSFKNGLYMVTETLSVEKNKKKNPLLYVFHGGAQWVFVLVGVTGEFYSSSTVSDHLWRRLLVSGKFPAQSDNFLVVLIIFGDCYGLFRRIF
jgi:hypothetical protein